MDSKSLSSKNKAEGQGTTVFRPGDFPIGSPESRAAARLLLQGISSTGGRSSECICFPEDEQPFFQTSEEHDLAASVQCPLHGQRFTREHLHLFVAAWRWKNEVKYRWPTLSAQFHKAWKASFTTGDGRKG